MGKGFLWRDSLSRDELVSAVNDLPSRLQLEILRDYDVGTLKDNAGLQWEIVPSEVVVNKGGKPRQGSGKADIVRREYDDLTLAEKLWETINSVRAYDRTIAQSQLNDAEMLSRLQPQRNSVARDDLKAALANTATATTALGKGPGQVGSHSEKFKGPIRLDNATQYMWDSHDRLYGGLIGLGQQGHVLAKSNNPEVARDISLMRNQQGEVNWYDGDGNYVNMRREENLLNGKRKALERLGGLIAEYENSAISVPELDRLSAAAIGLLTG